MGVSNKKAKDSRGSLDQGDQRELPEHDQRDHRNLSMESLCIAVEEFQIEKKEAKHKKTGTEATKRFRNHINKGIGKRSFKHHSCTYCIQSGKCKRVFENHVLRSEFMVSGTKGKGEIHESTQSVRFGKQGKSLFMERHSQIQRKPLEFQIGDKVMLKVSPWKDIVRFGKQDESQIIPSEEVQIEDKLQFVEEPVEVMDREVKKLKRSRIPIVKIIWNSKRGPEFTWEREDRMKEKYPHLFS
ncbi:hypothetical protein E3N88_41412 [Mikania micrantha]|uniref:Reverse transcriptase domain-containing protein n=1 Tax=Mikania micrantha TaxID=192012 RepID=A0A5N6LQI3_9ASTR|nr:hypothetical protein E3N88_41412 [Mikania micrantha]